MRELAILTFVTLDGVMQAPSMPEEDGSGGFEQGGWARTYWDDVMQQVSREAMAETYDLLLGRVTYEIFAAAFAQADSSNPVADKLNQAKKYVVSSTLKELTWQNSERIDGDVPARISQLKRDDGPLLQVHGSWQLIQTLLRHRLIDEFRLWTFPVVVGAGKHLFGDGAVPASFRLVKLEPCASGPYMSIWRQA